ncbi:Folylpolyglutamate synthase [Pseudobythopirellula maris]|uniref:Dihydrofolate synthase/folylpolyglutamate synthase n=1 Tax=Pseudobythopirellula maris TaxID=2527991 RepID=A0A5C5ZN91_9BACT|nr:Mur ligase family protein [Pseudobythopirellula maris]TWT88640.1 Folylpolyglutamate synthase [Pseudobythopirellula maris]
MSDPAPLTTDARRDAALAWLYGRINYEHSAPIPYSEQGMKLDRMRELLRRLGDPHKRLRTVHIAGTKGKGSTAAMVASAIREAGLKVGVYSSPHLERFEERIAVDGEPCPPGAFADLVDRVRPVAEAMDREKEGGGPTYFDLATAMAMLRLADERVDAAVLEVGLGGRLDSTNVCLPAVCVVTSISLDHTEQLGTSLEGIAREKGGIIKPGAPAVSGVMAPGPREAIAAIAAEQGCRLWQRGRDYALEASTDGLRFTRTLAGGGVETIDGVTIGLLGEHQQSNAAVALAALTVLRDVWAASEPELAAALTHDALRRGLQRARLAGRVEWLAPVDPALPRVVIDCAHNAASAAALGDALATLEQEGRFAADRRVLVLAVSGDKDAGAIARELAPRFDHVVVTRFVENPRAIAPAELARVVHAVAASGAKVHTVDEPGEAWRRANELAAQDHDAPEAGAGVVVIAGSFFLAAELRPLVLRETSPVQGDAPDA